MEPQPIKHDNYFSLSFSFFILNYNDYASALLLLILLDSQNCYNPKLSLYILCKDPQQKEVLKCHIVRKARCLAPLLIAQVSLEHSIGGIKAANAIANYLVLIEGIIHNNSAANIHATCRVSRRIIIEANIIELVAIESVESPSRSIFSTCKVNSSSCN